MWHAVRFLDIRRVAMEPLLQVGTLVVGMAVGTALSRLLLVGVLALAFRRGRS
jgi:hypothetical protein